MKYEWRYSFNMKFKEQYTAAFYTKGEWEQDILTRRFLLTACTEWIKQRLEG